MQQKHKVYIVLNKIFSQRNIFSLVLVDNFPHITYVCELTESWAAAVVVGY